MIESVVDGSITESPNDPLFKHFKALDPSLDRGMLTKTEIADANCKEVLLLDFHNCP